MVIYFAQCEEGGYIKIGYSKDNPSKRVSGLNVASPFEVNLLVVIEGERSDEYLLHERFRNLRVKGEWFRPSGELMGFIDELMAERSEQEEARERQEKIERLWSVQEICDYLRVSKKVVMSWIEQDELEVLNPDEHKSKWEIPGWAFEWFMESRSTVKR